MKLRLLREQVCDANKMLPKLGLTILIWGNVSAFDSENGLMVIKPSGVTYDELTPENMVVVALDGTVVEGELRPSSDTDTHLELYRSFPCLGSVVHTHSPWASIWAQMGRDILDPCGYDFWGDILCTRAMTAQEIQHGYERNTGRVIIETLSGKDIGRQFAVLVREHDPFVWENTPRKAVEKATALEQVAMMAWYARVGAPDVKRMSADLMKKHFERKHGKGAYYGQ